MNILFVCKYNRFRSKIAESYFKKINKNKNINVKSAGIIRGHYPLDKREVEVAKSMGIKLDGKPVGVSTDLMRKVDLIVIVANNVPKKIFNYDGYIGKVRAWKVTDIFHGDNKVLIENRIKRIKKRVERLVRELENEK